MNQPDLFEPATWGAPLPLGPRVKRSWKKPTYVIEAREPSVADLLDRTWEPAPWPKGYACIYKATLIGTTRAYVGKAVDLRERFVVRLRCHDDYFDRALRKHGPENFTIEVLWIAFSEADAYAQEGAFIEAAGAREGQGGFNIAEGGEGWTSDELRRWCATPAGRASTARAAALGGEVNARRAGYPKRRVWEVLENADEWLSKNSIAARAGMTKVQAGYCLTNLLKTEPRLIGAGGIYHIVTLEEAADLWASGPNPSLRNRMLGALTSGPRTLAELMGLLGATSDAIMHGIYYMRRNGYNIECRGAKYGPGGSPGTYHLLPDDRLWSHLGVMDLRGAAYDDRE